MREKRKREGACGILGARRCKSSFKDKNLSFLHFPFMKFEVIYVCMELYFKIMMCIYKCL
jgi:hypothetical protein